MLSGLLRRGARFLGGNRPVNGLYFFCIGDPAFSEAPHDEWDEMTLDEAVAAARWAVSEGCMIEIYVKPLDDRLNEERGHLPYVGWTIGGSNGAHVGYGLGDDVTDALEREVRAREGQPVGWAWFRSLLERSLHAV